MAAQPLTQHLTSLRVLSLVSFLWTVQLLYVASTLPLFDSSPHILLPETQQTSLLRFLARPLLRWDAFHFVHIALEGYIYEYEWAFFPGASFVMRTAAWCLKIVRLLRPDETLDLEHLLIAGALTSSLCGTVTTIYELTLYHFGSSSMAFLAALLSLLPSSPATLRFSVYNEPFFTYLSYKGMLYCTRSRWLSATLCFTLAAAFRSNGVMLCIYVIWGLIGEPLLSGRRLRIVKCLQATILSLVICTPFMFHQYRAYTVYCIGPSSASHELPPWCNATPPFIYTYVQKRYWNSGFMLYWTISQLPNILLATPPLLSLLAFSIIHIRTCLLPRLFALLTSLRTGKPPPPPSDRGLAKLSITPHAVHALALALLLLFAAHTQIALRLVASLPFTYWAAARLLIEYPRIGKWWVAWSVVWGSVSVILWAVFLPPA